jgi:cell division protein FtsB
MIFKKTTTRTSFFSSGKFLALGFLLIGFLIFASFKEHQRQTKINEKIKELQSEAQQLTNQNQEFSQLLSYLGSEEYVELQARRDFNYQKEGEKVVVVKSVDNGQTAVLIDERSNWQKWRSFIFGE